VENTFFSLSLDAFDGEFELASVMFRFELQQVILAVGKQVCVPVIYFTNL
jgi:hypothetical protein